MSFIIFISISVVLVVLWSVARGRAARHDLNESSTTAGSKIPTGRMLQRYQVMSRLLEGGDFEFLARQPGFDARLERQVRAERRRVFALYLNRLVEDFDSIHSELLSMNMSCPDERSEAALDLMLQRCRFHALIGWVRFQLVLHRFGLAQVDAQRVLRFLPTMQARAQRVAAAGIAA